MINWPSWRSEWLKVVNEPTGHENKPPLHAGQIKGLAVPSERKLTAAEESRMRLEIQEQGRK